MEQMFSWVPSLQGVAHALRHPVLDLAHPLPERLDVSLGRRGTMQQHLIVYTLAAVDGIEGRAHVVNHNSAQVTLVDEHGTARGAVTVCRYLGRLWRLYPVYPRNALTVDEFLELLADLDEYDDHTLLATVDARLGADAFLGGFQAPTIADVCWHACICWLYGRGWAGSETLPNLSRWFQTMQQQANPTIGGLAGAAGTGAAAAEEEEEVEEAPSGDDETSSTVHAHWE